MSFFTKWMVVLFVVLILMKYSALFSAVFVVSSMTLLTASFIFQALPGDSCDATENLSKTALVGLFGLAIWGFEFGATFVSVYISNFA